MQLKASTYQFVVDGPDGGRLVEPCIGWMMHFDVIVHRPNGDDFCGDPDVMRMLALAVAILAPGSAPPVWYDPAT